MVDESCGLRLEVEEISPEDETHVTTKRRRIEELGKESNDDEMDVSQPTHDEEKMNAAMTSRSKHVRGKRFLLDTIVSGQMVLMVPMWKRNENDLSACLGMLGVQNEHRLRWLMCKDRNCANNKI